MDVSLPFQATNQVASSVRAAARKFHSGRRDTLLARLPADSTLICIGAPPAYLQPFRQDGNLWYLSGIENPDAVVILRNYPGRKPYALLLPSEPSSKSEIVWGEWLDSQRARLEHAADIVYTQRDFSRCIARSIEGSRHIFLVHPGQSGSDLLRNPSNPDLVTRVKQAVRRHRPSARIEDGSRYLHELRLIKTTYETALAEKAAGITMLGHLEVMSHCRRHFGSKEGRPLYSGELQAILERKWASEGAVAGYSPIVAPGERSCYIHDYQSCSEIRPGQLLMLDAGARYGNYTADVTRTWPVSGRFSPEQKLIYQACLNVLRECERILKPGATIEELERRCLEALTHELRELRILRGLPRGLIESNAALPFCPHAVTHFIGLDVHDVNGGRPDDILSRPLQPGMLLTLEPGIYLHPLMVQTRRLSSMWSGIGVRIEDDYLITENGFENLSAALPREARELESFLDSH